MSSWDDMTATRADVRPGSFEALRLDDAELLAGRRPQEPDRALPPGGVSMLRSRL